MSKRYPELDNALVGSVGASRCLRWYRNHPEKALEMVTEFHDLKLPEGADKRRYNLAMSFIFSTTGNCYLVMKQPAEAVKWYRKAAQYSKGGRYSPLYARTVLRHRLSEHYQTALECAKASSEELRRLPFVLKVFSYACWGWQLHPRLWRFMPTEGSLPTRIQDRIEQSP